jgi:hypothetical protein
MKRFNPNELKELSVIDLVERFSALALAQDDADLDSDFDRYNRHFRAMMDVQDELKRRPGDQRRALLKLYDHPNAQVRLMAAKVTLAVEPQAARRLLQRIAESAEHPQAGDAGMSLSNLDRGVFKPS